MGGAAAPEIVGGNGSHPDAVDYVLVPLDVDRGETETPVGVVPLTMADLDRGVTVIGAPRDLDDAQMRALVQALSDARKERGHPRKFLLVDGEIGARWRFWRLIRRDRYDPDFNEEIPVA